MLRMNTHATYSRERAYVNARARTCVYYLHVRNTTATTTMSRAQCRVHNVRCVRVCVYKSTDTREYTRVTALIYIYIHIYVRYTNCSRGLTRSATAVSRKEEGTLPPRVINKAPHTTCYTLINSKGRSCAKQRLTSTGTTLAHDQPRWALEKEPRSAERIFQ